MNTLSKNKRFLMILAAVPLVLLIPFVAMQISTEVQWSGFDFVVAATLLLALGLGVEAVLRAFKSRKSRILLLSAVLLTFLLVWMELAVGLFGTPFAGS